jgi:hypothetical protein
MTFFKSLAELPVTRRKKSNLAIGKMLEIIKRDLWVLHLKAFYFGIALRVVVASRSRLKESISASNSA